MLSKAAWQAGTPLPEIPLLTWPAPASEQKQRCGVYKSLIWCRAVTAFPLLVGELLSTTGIWGMELAAEKCTPSFSERKIPSSPMLSLLTFLKSESLSVRCNIFNNNPNDLKLKSYRKALKLKDLPNLCPLDKFCLLKERALRAVSSGWQWPSRGLGRWHRAGDLYSRGRRLGQCRRAGRCVGSGARLAVLAHQPSYLHIHILKLKRCSSTP